MTHAHVLPFELGEEPEIVQWKKIGVASSIRCCSSFPSMDNILTEEEELELEAMGDFAFAGYVEVAEGEEEEETTDDLRFAGALAQDLIDLVTNDNHDDATLAQLVERFVLDNPDVDVNLAIARCIHLGKFECFYVLVRSHTVSYEGAYQYRPGGEIESTHFDHASTEHGRDAFAVEILKDARFDIYPAGSTGLTPIQLCAIWNFPMLERIIMCRGEEMRMEEVVAQTERLEVLIDCIHELGSSAHLESTARESRQLLSRYITDPGLTIVEVMFKWDQECIRHHILFVFVVLLCDGILAIRPTVEAASPVARFFRTVARLPMELQMWVCCAYIGDPGRMISVRHTDDTTRFVARHMLQGDGLCIANKETEE
jgi:hypothetical protein